MKQIIAMSTPLTRSQEGGGSASITKHGRGDSAHPNMTRRGDVTVKLPKDGPFGDATERVSLGVVAAGEVEQA